MSSNLRITAKRLFYKNLAFYLVYCLHHVQPFVHIILVRFPFTGRR
jgi:hypothetical protein